jgi:uncharacterized protein (TIGR02444 family)
MVLEFLPGFYARPGIADICLVLQDRFSLEVNVLLYVLWQANASAGWRRWRSKG